MGAWQSTPAFLPGESSQTGGVLVVTVHRGKESDMIEVNLAHVHTLKKMNRDV